MSPDGLPAGQPLSVLHRQIDQLHGVKQLEHAQRLLQQAFQAEPSDADNHYYAARIAYARDRHAEAAIELQHVLGQQPQHGAALRLFVLVAIEQRRFSDAEQAAIVLIRESPGDGELFAQYGWLMLLTLHVDKARALVAEAIRLSPEGILSRTVNLLVALIDGEGEHASKQLQELVRDNPTAQHVSWLVVTVLAEQGRYSQALPIAQGILRAAPTEKETVEAVIDLKARASWVAQLFWPMTRFGWGGSIALWMVAMLTLRVLARVNVSAAVTLGLVWFTYVVGSWVYLPLLRKWYGIRGF